MILFRLILSPIGAVVLWVLIWAAYYYCLVFYPEELIALFDLNRDLLKTLTAHLPKEAGASVHAFIRGEIQEKDIFKMEVTILVFFFWGLLKAPFRRTRH